MSTMFVSMLAMGLIETTNRSEALPKHHKLGQTCQQPL